ncbi:CRISPR-associated helicase Cas3' [Acidaminococcus timonensis]|uniref:CRISPR-associated helicase Cas3' n=1 Tax=Acidaminococcus timonensis TaxID=1871002 RepID=UPI0026F137FE|nr:CRISPR-associated helicase Cas3' [Acidaminococcus timonensis]
MNPFLLQCLPAKANRKDPGLWLPLWMHLRDTAYVMEYLVDAWLPEATKRVILPDEDEELLSKIAILLGALHDLGKSSPSFSSMILQHMDETAADRLEQYGLPISSYRAFPNRSRSPHALMGETVLLKNSFPLGFATMVGSHHGMPHSLENRHWVENQISPFSTTSVNYYDSNEQGTGAIWKELRTDLIRRALDLAQLSVEDIPVLSMPAQVLLTGLLIMADWIASNETYFPLIPVSSIGREEDYPERAERGLRDLDLPDIWDPDDFTMSDIQFQKKFGFLPNAVQKAVITAITQSTKPGIFILEAQMGVGKTEAALAGADLLGSRDECGGLFFGLPTQATSNGIFPRIEEWASKEAEAEKTTLGIRLAHGAAEMNDDYRTLFHGTAITDEDNEDEGVLVHPWFEGRKQALLADFVIGTVDQLLMAALKQKHVMLRHLGLAGKVVIVDECHAYDAYMNQFLYRALNWLGTYGVPVILLSATLPYAKRTAMIRAYLGLRTEVQAGQKEPWMLSKDYPLLTWTDGPEVKQVKIILDTPEQKVQIQKIHDEDIIQILQDRLSDGGCAGIIVNTVRRAQQLAVELEQKLTDDEIMVFHAGFTMEQKAAIEHKLLERIGKKSRNQRNHFIVIGTQVMEQSLDIDLDLLLTDLCPMDLLFQRIGRLHRHTRTRPAKLQTPTCLVMGANPEDGLEEGAKAVYGEYLLLRTRELLPDQFSLPLDISRYVQNVYDENFIIDPASEKEALGQYHKVLKEKEQAAQTHCLGLPRKSKRNPDRNTLEGWLDATPNLNEKQLEASVRDGGESIEVILLQQCDEPGVFVDAASRKVKFYGDLEPSNEEARRIYRQKVRLPAFFGKGTFGEHVVKELEQMTKKWVPLWLHNPILSGELFLVFNQEGKTELAGYTIRYDPFLGLSYEKEK